jgi:hypothetical protein
MVHADLICVPQLMSGEQALAAQIGSYLKSVWEKPWWEGGFASWTCR